MIGPGGPGGPPGGGGGGFRRFGGGGGQAGQLNVSAFYTRRLADDLTLFQGQPAIDLVSSAPLGGALGGGPDKFEFDGGVTWRGAGLRFNGVWNSGYDVPGATAAHDLAYSGAVTLNLRAFLSFDARPALVRKHPALKGLRLAARIDNVFDEAPEVTDPTGVTPYPSQEGFLAPTGRTIALSIRKQW